MTKVVRILGIPGSLRKHSHNRNLLRAAAKLLPEGAELETLELEGIPLFNEDVEAEPPAKVVELKQRVRAADAILFVTPEYNYSVPGVLKNAIDWGSRPPRESAWRGKPAAIMGASIGTGATSRAQHHLRQILVALDMHPVGQPEVLIASAHERFDADGNLTDERTIKLVGRLLERLVDWTRRLQPPA